MADVAQYQNRLKGILDGNFQGTDGFKFALDQGLGAISRANSRMRGSGNVLAALTKYGTGLAVQDRGAEIDRLTRLSGQEQQYDIGQGANANAAEGNRLTGIRDTNNLNLGTEQNRLTGIRDNNALTLGTQANSNTAQRNAWDYELGTNQNTNTRTANDQRFGVDMYRANNDLALGSQANANTAQRNWWDNVNTRDANSITAANGENQYNLGVGRNSIDWYNARTNRGTARSNSAYNQYRMNGGS